MTPLCSPVLRDLHLNDTKSRCDFRFCCKYSGLNTWLMQRWIPSQSFVMGFNVAYDFSTSIWQKKKFWKFSVKSMWKLRNLSHHVKKQLLWLIGWITADGTNFFEILVPFPFFPRFQIYARSGDLIRISKDNQEKKLSFLRQFDRKIYRILFLSNWCGKIICNFESHHKALWSCL